MTNSPTQKLPLKERMALTIDQTLRLVEVYYWVLQAPIAYAGKVVASAGSGLLGSWHLLPESFVADERAPGDHSYSTLLVLPLYPWIYAEDL